MNTLEPDHETIRVFARNNQLDFDSARAAMLAQAEQAHATLTTIAPAAAKAIAAIDAKAIDQATESEFRRTEILDGIESLGTRIVRHGSFLAHLAEFRSYWNDADENGIAERALDGMWLAIEAPCPNHHSIFASAVQQLLETHVLGDAARKRIASLQAQADREWVDVQKAAKDMGVNLGKLINNLRIRC